MAGCAVLPGPALLFISSRLIGQWGVLAGKTSKLRRIRKIGIAAISVYVLPFRSGLMDTQDMTRDAAVVAIVLALMGGYYWARWRRAETTKRLAKAATDTAGRGAWRARGMILLIGVAVYAVIDLWLRGRGR